MIWRFCIGGSCLNLAEDVDAGELRRQFPQALGLFRIDGVAFYAAEGKALVIVAPGDIAVFAIQSAKAIELRRCRRPHRLPHPVAAFSAFPGVRVCRWRRSSPMRASLPARGNAAVAWDHAGMQREGAYTGGSSSFVEVHGE